MTDLNRPLLAHERFRRALAARTGNRLHEASDSDINSAIAGAALSDAPPDLQAEIVAFAIQQWWRDCTAAMLTHLELWQPDEAQLAQPN